MNSEKNWPTEIRLREDQVQHQKQNAGAQEVDASALQKAKAADIADFLEFQLENLAGCGVEAVDFLIRQAEGFNEFDIA